MIEPCWGWMKRKACQHVDFEQRGKLPGIWEDIWWEKLDQDRIRAWIERIMRHIDKVIELEGDNKYREGAKEEGPRRHRFAGDKGAIAVPRLKSSVILEDFVVTEKSS